VMKDRPEDLDQKKHCTWYYHRLLKANLRKQKLTMIRTGRHKRWEEQIIWKSYDKIQRNAKNRLAVSYGEACWVPFARWFVSTLSSTTSGDIRGKKRTFDRM